MFGMLEAMLSFLRRQIGLRTDASSATGSLHAKLTSLRDKVDMQLDVPVSDSKNVVTVQRGLSVLPDGEAGGTLDVAISAVDLGKAFVSLGGYNVGMATSEPRSEIPIVRLTSATNVRITRAISSASYALTVAWEVVEIA